MYSPYQPKFEPLDLLAIAEKCVMWSGQATQYHTERGEKKN